MEEKKEIQIELSAEVADAFTPISLLFLMLRRSSLLTLSA